MLHASDDATLDMDRLRRYRNVRTIVPNGTKIALLVIGTRLTALILGKATDP